MKRTNTMKKKKRIRKKHYTNEQLEKGMKLRLTADKGGLRAHAGRKRTDGD